MATPVHAYAWEWYDAEGNAPGTALPTGGNISRTIRVDLASNDPVAYADVIIAAAQARLAAGNRVAIRWWKEHEIAGTGFLKVNTSNFFDPTNWYYSASPYVAPAIPAALLTAVDAFGARWRTAGIVPSYVLDDEETEIGYDGVRDPANRRDFFLPVITDNKDNPYPNTPNPYLGATNLGFDSQPLSAPFRLEYNAWGYAAKSDILRRIQRSVWSPINIGPDSDLPWASYKNRPGASLAKIYAPEAYYYVFTSVTPPAWATTNKQIANSRRWIDLISDLNEIRSYAQANETHWIDPWIAPPGFGVAVADAFGDAFDQRFGTWTVASRLPFEQILWRVVMAHHEAMGIHTYALWNPDVDPNRVANCAFVDAYMSGRTVGGKARDNPQIAADAMTITTQRADGTIFTTDFELIHNPTTIYYRRDPGTLAVRFCVDPNGLVDMPDSAAVPQGGAAVSCAGGGDDGLEARPTGEEDDGLEARPTEEKSTDGGARWSVRVGDCRDVMAGMDADSVDAVVTDPPYGLAFMGKAWDHAVPGPEFFEAMLRVAKPGAHLVAFGGTRLYHRMTVAIEDAGWEVRDCLMWLYGSGFPKSHDVSKAIDREAGAEREVVGVFNRTGKESGTYGEFAGPSPITAPATSEAKRWQGWGTALKPAWEPIVLARKPLDGTVAANHLRHGVGGLNIDGCRVEGKPRTTHADGNYGGKDADRVYSGAWQPGYMGEGPSGRWPANLILDADAGAALDGQSGQVRSGVVQSKPENITSGCGYNGGWGPHRQGGYGDTGGASRFFYCPKADHGDRNEGCVEFEKKHGWEVTGRAPGSAGGKASAYAGTTESARRNHHPTVKPHGLMRWLVRLVCPADGLVLDPFMGSGSTGKACLPEGMRFAGIDLDPEYAAIAAARIKAAEESVGLFGGGA